MLLDRLDTDVALRRICGWEKKSAVPSESVFSRAFAEFSDTQLPQRVHEALIRNTHHDRLVGHLSRDSTAIEARRLVVRSAERLVDPGEALLDRSSGIPPEVVAGQPGVHLEGGVLAVLKGEPGAIHRQRKRPPVEPVVVLLHLVVQTVDTATQSCRTARTSASTLPMRFTSRPPTVPPTVSAAATVVPMMAFVSFVTVSTLTGERFTPRVREGGRAPASSGASVPSRKYA